MKLLWRRLRVPSRESSKERGQAEITSVQNICCMELGELLKVWLKQVFNTTISFEEVPNCLKTSLIKPIYKGRGKDPPVTSSFRGVALSSTIAEYIILERMKPILLEFNSPHFLQTTYQRGVSCGNAIFATQEAALKVLREARRSYHFST